MVCWKWHSDDMGSMEKASEILLEGKIVSYYLKDEINGQTIDLVWHILLEVVQLYRGSFERKDKLLMPREILLEGGIVHQGEISVRTVPAESLLTMRKLIWK